MSDEPSIPWRVFWWFAAYVFPWLAVLCAIAFCLMLLAAGVCILIFTRNLLK